MYRIDLKEEATSELQKYLREVSYALSFTPHVQIDGIYEDRTREAVIAFQRIMRLPANGRVDFETWNSIYAAYLDAKSRKEPPLLLSPDSLPITLGARGGDVSIAKAILRSLSLQTGEEGLPDRERFTRADAYATRRLQRRYGLSPSGVIDFETWSKMVAEYQHNTRFYPKSII